MRRVLIISIGLLLLAFIVADHLAYYRYDYEPLGTERYDEPDRYIVKVNRVTRDACVLRLHYGWTCVDPETYAQVKRQGTMVLPVSKYPLLWPAV